MSENSLNTGAENTAKSKSVRISLEEHISRMKIAFSNAKLPQILPQLQTLGYTEEKLNHFLEQLAELEHLSQTQKKEYAEQYAETEKFNTKRQEIDEVFRRHLAFCKILFKGDVKANSLLGLSEGRKNAYGSWFQQVSNFYAQLLDNAEFLAKVATINITEENLNAQKKALADLAKIKESQKKETSEAQKATETRDKAFDELYPHYSELVAYAKVLFEDDQNLEALGIVVKR